MAAARHVALEVSDHLPDAVVDIGAVELMLVNLVSNGIKYAISRPPRSCLRCAGTEPPGSPVSSAAPTTGLDAAASDVLEQADSLRGPFFAALGVSEVIVIDREWRGPRSAFEW
jgi:hypothetical protein